MKIEFDEKGQEYVEIKKSSEGVSLVISVKDPKSPKSSIINSAEVSLEEFKKLVSELNLR